MDSSCIKGNKMQVSTSGKIYILMISVFSVALSRLTESYDSSISLCML